MKKIIMQLSILVLIFSSGCTERTGRSEKSKTVIKKNYKINIYDPITDTKKSIQFFASQMDFVPLQFSKECPLAGNILKIEMSDYYIFIATLGAVYKFNRTGSFIQKIGRMGKGPGEYPQINSIQIDQSQKLVNIFPGKTQGKIIQYSFAGEFIREIRFTNNDFTAFDSEGSNFIFYPFCWDKFQDNYKKLTIIDTTGQKKCSFSSNIFPAIKKGHGKVIAFGPTRDWSWKQNNKLYYLESGNDTIFRIANDSLKQQWILTGENRLPPEKFHFSKPGSLSSDYIQLIDEAIIPANSCLYESNRFLFIRCSSHKKNYFAAYDKQENKLYRSDYEYPGDNNQQKAYFLDDLLTGLPFNPVYRIANNEFAAIYYPFQIISQKGIISKFYTQNPKPATKKFLEMCNQLNENDNPILLIAKMK